MRWPWRRRKDRAMGPKNPPEPVPPDDADMPRHGNPDAFRCR